MKSMRVTILQWNVWVNEDIHNIAAFLTQNPADIICLQELTLHKANQSEDNTPKFIAAQLGYHYFAAEMPWNEPAKIAVGIFSKYPILTSRSVYINEPTGSGGFDDEHRTYAEVTLDLDGRHVTVGTTHMSYTHRFRVTARKRDETNKLVAELSKNKTSYIFTGDLNATPCSYTYQKLRKILRNAGPHFWHKTWTTKPFDCNGFKTAKRRWRLDYIFASKDIKVLNSRIDKTEYSDHLPVRAEIEL